MITNTTDNLHTNEESENEEDISSLSSDSASSYAPSVLMPNTYSDAPPSYDSVVFGVHDNSVQILPEIIPMPNVNEETSSETTSESSIETTQTTDTFYVFGNWRSYCRNNFECSKIRSYKIPFVCLCVKILVWIVLIKNITRANIIMSLILCNGLSALMQGCVMFFVCFCAEQSICSLCDWIREFLVSIFFYLLMFLIDFYHINHYILHQNTSAN